MSVMSNRRWRFAVRNSNRACRSTSRCSTTTEGELGRPAALGVPLVGTEQLLPVLIGHGRDLAAIDEEGGGGIDTGLMAGLSRGDARLGQRLVGQAPANLCLAESARA